MKPWACVTRFGGVGDNLMLSSVLPQLAKEYCVEVIVQHPYHVVLENNPYIDKLTVRQPGDLPHDNVKWQAWFTDRAKEYKLFVNLSHSCETMLALMPGQTQFSWPAEWRRKWCGHSYVKFIHEVVGVPYEFGVNFYPTEDEQLKAIETKRVIGNKAIGWCISGSRLDKIYPQSPIAIARLIKEVGVPVVMFGASGKDFEMAKQVQAHVKQQNGTDDGLHLGLSPDPDKPSWPLRRVLSQLQYCDLVIGPDTGPLWSVANCAMPKMVLLSHASPENITTDWTNTTTMHADQKRVPCWPCHCLHDTVETCTPNEANNGAACISDISVDTIVVNARKLLPTGE